MSDLNVGNCIAAPTCTKVIPIYPVRYAVMPVEKSDFRMVSVAHRIWMANFLHLPETAYCLRNLRDETYVYIYDPNAREKMELLSI